jgi:hypothetical protein
MFETTIRRYYILTLKGIDILLVHLTACKTAWTWHHDYKLLSFLLVIWECSSISLFDKTVFERKGELNFQINSDIVDSKVGHINFATLYFCVSNFEENHVILARFAYVGKLKVSLWDYLAVCVFLYPPFQLLNTRTNNWGIVYVNGYYVNPSEQSLCLYADPFSLIVNGSVKIIPRHQEKNTTTDQLLEA